ncbi:cupin domain-containing protein [Neptuniibacter sp. CAU 1671]|uniref:cupin domain-containing protein n=1 Tax=Neptuniibacter sp. CAU 1671 TaxID=3032593 RepID=UPI0023DAE574|nr:cupin domain-containing protein [Neptuniibacter sp. CAU 1671]MDF2182962.1 cupin domain-containing protein [Neptuniibacter sp. CAU 1671]
MNLLNDLPANLQEEVFETLLEKGPVRIERIVSNGQITPEDQVYDQHWDEWVLLLQGEATLLLVDTAEEIHLGTGDTYYLPAGCRHRVTYTSSAPPAIWLAIHFGAES